MESNYKKIMLMNLDRLYMRLPENLACSLGTECRGEEYTLKAFGRDCRIHPNGIDLDCEPEDGPMGVILSLYALNATEEECIMEPVAAFREMPDSGPYVGAFRTHTENILVPFVEEIKAALPRLLDHLAGREAPPGMCASADFSFVVQPLPKVRLIYQCYLPDEDFPASVTCLYSNNAHRFLPTDALADVGEYTSKRILEIIGLLREGTE